MSEKREQVFVSSTYTDLVAERHAVTQTLLKADCIPAGMELFPASDSDKWNLIRRVIDGCDYYLLVLGGRYGSIDPDDNLSFTEKEYDYAKQTGKPVMAFLIKDVGALRVDQTDDDAAKKEALLAFRARVESFHTVSYWVTGDDLAGKVALALLDARRNYPAVGWVRGDHAMTPEIQTEIAELKIKVADLTKELEEARAEKHIVPDWTAGDDDPYSLQIQIDYYRSGDMKDGKIPYGTQKYFRYERVAPSWNTIFAHLAPVMLNEATETELDEALDSFALDQFFENEKSLTPQESGSVQEVTAVAGELENVIVQVFTLGLITQGTRNRTSSDSNKYWKLTPAGQDQAMRLRADRKVSS
jgi:hypothetical protein